jgi:protein phosphatase
MNIWGITDIGAVRNDNQDNYQTDRLDEDILLAVVCDGMGGARAGGVASSLAVAGFVSSVKDQYQAGERDWPYLLEQAVYDANERVHEASLSHEDYRGMGTTLVAALVTPEKIWVANVGDSRCYQIVEGDITRISRDHSLVEDLVQRGELTPEEARVHPKKNLITRALGVDRSVRVDIFERPNLGGYLLLCSDGLSNEVTDEELRREVVAEDKEHCCQRLLKLALDHGAHDNVTVVIAQL